MTTMDIVSKLLFRLFSKRWAEGKLRHIGGYLPPGGRLLDLGCGKGAVSLMLKNQGYEIVCADITDKSAAEQIQPVLYDGLHLPWPDDCFDAVLLLTVLHHTNNPEQVLREAKRVGKRIIIIEDVYTNWVQKRLTFLLDSLFNLEFFGHPHTNKTDEGWRRCFDSLNLDLKAAFGRRVMLVCHQIAYCLDKQQSTQLPDPPTGDPVYHGEM